MIIQYLDFARIEKNRSNRRWFIRHFGTLMNRDDFYKLYSKKTIKKMLKKLPHLKQHKFRLLNLVPSPIDVSFLINKIPSSKKRI